MTAPTHRLIRRSLRRFVLGSGPLKRGSDRLQMIGRLVVVLSFLAAPPLAVAAATTTTTHLEAVAGAEAAERSRTDAVLLEDAPARRLDGDDAYATTKVTARAVWPGPGGASREGLVPVRPRTPAGTAVPVWVTREGTLTRAPLDRAAIPASAAAMGALPLLGVPLGTWTLYAALCSALDAHRARRWAQDWAAVEPDWNSRLR